MKKILVLILISMLFVVGCSNEKALEKTTPSEYNENKEVEKPSLTEKEKQDDKGIQIIKDNVFIQLTNDMYYNSEDYKDQKFQIEGILDIDNYNGEKHLNIIRRTPGCCGSDGVAGLEVSWDGDIPEQDSWVIGKGVWKKNNKSLYNGWILVLYFLDVQKTKGNEFLDFNY